MAEAQAAGVELQAVGPLAASAAGDAVLARAIDVLADLSRRGYSGGAPSRAVEDMTGRDPAALGRVVAGVEQYPQPAHRQPGQALEALARNLTAGGRGASFDSAMTRALEDGDCAGNASPGAPGKSGQAPGHENSSGASKAKGPKK